MTSVDFFAASSRTTATLRTRWAAAGAAIAVALGAGGLGIAGAADAPSTDYRPIEPCRLVDTRASTAIGDHATPIGAGQTRTFDARGAVGECNLPADTIALSINLASVNATTQTFFTAHSAGSERPISSQLNPNAIIPVTANGFDVALSADGKFNVYNNAGTSHMLIDVLGVYTGHEPLIPADGKDGTDGQNGSDGTNAPTLAAFYADTDNDTYGDSDSFEFAYERPTGFVANKLDCDDTAASVKPGALEVVFDDIDSDCDGDGGGTLTRAGHATGASSVAADISQDGRFIAFQSGASDHVDGDTNSQTDVFVTDTTTGTTTRVSTATDGTESNDASQNPSISTDGRYITYQSSATNLVDDDTNNRTDIFVTDTTTGTTTRVSTATDGTESNDASENPSISTDGRYITYQSGAATLVDDDTNDRTDVFVTDTTTGTTTRVSTASDGTEGDRGSYNPSISADGRYITFDSEARNLVDDDTNGDADVFVTDTTTGTIIMIDLSSIGDRDDTAAESPSISADGRRIAFQVSGDGSDQVYVADLDAGSVTLVSSASDGTPANDDPYLPAISADGRFIAFRSEATNLMIGGNPDSIGSDEIFVKDTLSGMMFHVSTSPGGESPDGESTRPSISGDGRYVAFESDSTNLVTGDENAERDVFVADLGAPAQT